MRAYKNYATSKQAGHLYKKIKAPMNTLAKMYVFCMPVKGRG